MAHRAEGPGALGTLVSLLAAAGHGTPILTRPVEVVGWAPADLAPQGVGTTLGHYAPSRMHLDHQWGCICWRKDRRDRSERRLPTGGIVLSLSPQRLACPPSALSPLDIVALKLPRLTTLPVPLTRGHDPTYLVAGTGSPAHWGYPRNPEHICKEKQSPALSGSSPRGLSASWWTWRASSPWGMGPVWGGEAHNSGRTLETKEAPTQGLTELRKGSTGQRQQVG